MSVIYKYPVDLTDDQQISMPVGAQVLTLQMQDRKPTIWALVNPDAPKEIRRFALFGTGHPFDPSGLTYVGTFQTRGLVFHLFEAK